ncbi:thioredoxin domain-containing protein [Patescibacteria group bacterium]|nr:thioredoxin domain-containing protein [Patescibacteria group bacterium]
MKKAKFKIHGMHCNSCAILIEERLKNLQGVIQTKISHESGKGVIVYDENAIEETEIQREIESVGEYSVEKIEDTEKEKNVKEDYSRPNLSIPISIIIAGLIIAGAIIINGDGGKKTISTGQIAQNLPVNDTQPPEVPAIAQFDITKNDHIRGNFDSPITLVEFSCFECPFSARHNPTLIKILDDYKGKVRLVYKHFPLGFHPNAQKAAEASECADEQGKFWEYHDKLFENFQLGYSIENFKQWAKDLGLNSGKFNDCLDSGKFAQKVRDDFQEGSAKGVNGTPATFINGQLVSGALPYESFKQIIDNLLSQ